MFKMKMFEDKEFNGAMASFLTECQDHRIPSIYNTKYRYVKEIVYDTEAEEKYGTSRAGYDEWKNTKKYNQTTSLGYSGVTSIRTLSDYKTGETLGYILETKETTNDSLTKMLNILEKAEEEFYKILDVTAFDTFNFWFQDQYDTMRNLEANSIISRIERLEGIINDYNEDEEFRNFINKIKD